MKQLNNSLIQRKSHPIRAIQFGEGNFLRAFVDYMIDIANEKGITDIGVEVVKSVPFGSLDLFRQQDNLFTVCLRGRQDGEVVESSRVVSCVQDTVACYEEFERYDEMALLDELRFIFSNTTEAGIVFDAKDINLDANPPITFPGKLTRLLYRRFKHFQGDPLKGLIIIPCELIERNGDNLKKCVLEYVELWNLGEEFAQWVKTANVFCNTLVDRIVTGYPGKEAAQEICDKLGYEDKLIDAAEPFGFWVIESEKDISAEFPLDKAGLPVVFTDNQKPYRERKVRILNGGHTTTVPAAYLAGEDIVRDCMADPTIRLFLEQTLNQEIIPTLTLPKQELINFSNSVLERFENPFIDHALLSICLNSISKWKARVLPTMRDSIQNTGNVPKNIAFSLAALIVFYNGSEIREGALVGHRGQDEYFIKDDGFVLEFFASNSSLPAKDLVHKVLSNNEFWGEDLTQYSNLEEMVCEDVVLIQTQGARAALEQIVN